MMALALTGRDKWFCAALPALLTVLAYGLVAARPLLRDCRAIQADLGRQESVASRTARLESARAENGRLGAALEAERRRAAELHGMEAVPRRGATLADLSRRCQKSGMSLLGATAAPGAASGPADGAGGATWRLELRGTFAEMMCLLEGLADGTMAFMPLGLDMAPAIHETASSDWVLTIRMGGNSGV